MDGAVFPYHSDIVVIQSEWHRSFSISLFLRKVAIGLSKFDRIIRMSKKDQTLPAGKIR